MATAHFEAHDSGERRLRIVAAHAHVEDGSARRLRVVAAAALVPAFPLCVAHGVLSHAAAPAVGLVPLAFSAGLSVFLLVSGRGSPPHADGDDEAEAGAGASAGQQQQQQHLEETPGPEVEEDEQRTQGESTALSPPQQEEGEEEEEEEVPQRQRQRRQWQYRHPILVFVYDAVLAAALMVVLVFTWTRTSGPAELAMLAAYATIPLLVNFLIHLHLAVRELSRGLALPGLTQWLAWQVVPADCPRCAHRLRPASAPTLPWLAAARNAPDYLPRPAPATWKPAFPSGRLPAWRPRLPASPRWSALNPASWLWAALARRRRGTASHRSYTPVSADEENQYRDEVDGDGDGDGGVDAGPLDLDDAPELAAHQVHGRVEGEDREPRVAEPEEEVVVGRARKDKGRKGSVALGSETGEAPAW